MKTSALLALSGSLLALASPIAKRDLEIEVEIVTDIVIVTVTVEAGAEETTTTVVPTTSAAVTTTTPYIPPPPVTTSTSIATSTSSSSSIETAVTLQAEVSVSVEAQISISTSTSVAVVSTSTTSAATVATPTDFSSTAVYHHNIHRANHSAPDASWNSDLASYAATVAATCVFAHDLTPGSSTGSYGQNIAMWGSSTATSSDDTSNIIAQAITDMWYNGEVTLFPSSSYGLDTPDMTDFDSWGHFSQVVWVASTEVGCAVQYCEAGTMVASMPSYFSVCNYRDAGNVGGEYGTNVLPSLGEASVVV